MQACVSESARLHVACTAAVAGGATGAIAAGGAAGAGGGASEGEAEGAGVSKEAAQVALTALMCAAAGTSPDQVHGVKMEVEGANCHQPPPTAKQCHTVGNEDVHLAARMSYHGTATVRVPVTAAAASCHSCHSLGARVGAMLAPGVFAPYGILDATWPVTAGSASQPLSQQAGGVTAMDVDAPPASASHSSSTPVSLTEGLCALLAHARSAQQAVVAVQVEVQAGPSHSPGHSQAHRAVTAAATAPVTGTAQGACAEQGVQLAGGEQAVGASACGEGSGDGGGVWVRSVAGLFPESEPDAQAAALASLLTAGR